MIYYENIIKIKSEYEIWTIIILEWLWVNNEQFLRLLSNLGIIRDNKTLFWIMWTSSEHYEYEWFIMRILSNWEKQHEMMFRF